MSGDRGDCAESGDDFEGTDKAEGIMSIDGSGSEGVLLFKKCEEFIGSFGAEGFTQDWIGRDGWKKRTFEECLNPEMRAAAENRLFATRVNINNRVMCVAEEVRNIVFFIRIGDIDEVMPDATGNIWGINV